VLKNFLAGLVLASVMPLALAQGVVGAPYIAVHGSATKKVAPDEFPLVVTLEETSKDTAAAQARIESLLREVLDAAATEKLADADIKVGNLSIEPSTEYDEGSRKRVFIGNTYQRIVELKFHRLESLRRALSKLPSGELVKVSTKEFQFSRSDEEKEALLVIAINNAKSTAEQMASGVGMRLAGVQSISNERIDTGIAYSDAYAPPAGASDLSGSVALKEGEVELRQDVYITYLISK